MTTLGRVIVSPSGETSCPGGTDEAKPNATEWVAMLADAQRQGRLDAELDRLQRVPLLIIDEVGYIPYGLRLRSAGEEPSQGWPTLRPALPAQISTGLDSRSVWWVALLPAQSTASQDASGCAASPNGQRRCQRILSAGSSALIDQPSGRIHV
jgi:hypothetical protein